MACQAANDAAKEAIFKELSRHQRTSGNKLHPSLVKQSLLMQPWGTAARAELDVGPVPEHYRDPSAPVPSIVRACETKLFLDSSGRCLLVVILGMKVGVSQKIRGPLETPRDMWSRPGPPTVWWLSSRL